MKNILIIFQKELTDNLRDRRTLTSMIMSAIASPALLVAMILVVGRMLVVDPQEHSQVLPVVRPDLAPGLIAFLESNNVTVVEMQTDPVQAVREGQEDLALIILPEYPEAFRRGEPAPLRLIIDSSRQSSTASIMLIRSLISQYASEVATLRLQARGVDPLLTMPIFLNLGDMATPQSQALIFLGALPFLLTMNVFTSGMSIVVDATVGERERGSLEPLLLNPALRREFVLGKLLAAVPVALGTLAAILFFFWLAFILVPIEKTIGFPMQLNGLAMLGVFGLFIPEVLLATAIQMLVATFSRGTKEAQTYLSLIPIVFSLPGMFLSFIPVESTLVRIAIPTYGQNLLINQILRGENIPPLHWIIVSLTTLALAAALILFAVRLYEGERALFGKS